VAGPITEAERARAGFLVETFDLVSVLMPIDRAAADGIGKSAVTNKPPVSNPTSQRGRAEFVVLPGTRSRHHAADFFEHGAA
jgi:hypothetical protein